MRRVVVTGMGAVTPLGNTATTFIDRLQASEIGIKPITSFDATATGIAVAGEVTDFHPETKIDASSLKKYDLFSQYSLYSAIEAVESSALDFQKEDLAKISVIYGSGIGGLHTIEEQITKMNQKGIRRISPLFIPKSIVNMAAANIAIHFGLHGTAQVVVTACASATNAIGSAVDAIRLGRSDVVITGGTEASINEIGIGGFAKLNALSTSTDPWKASLPFSKQRNGFVMGEGAGTLVIEELEHAKKRQAPILAEIVGYATNCDAYHLTAPDPSGKWPALCIKDALADAGIQLEQIGYINAHGTSTPANDVMEAKAIRQVFTDHCPLVSSIKGMTGHLLGAAGAVEAIATIAALKWQQLPVNVGCSNEDKDSECLIPLVQPDNAQQDVDYALSESFGFGGHNAVLVFKKWEGD